MGFTRLLLVLGEQSEEIRLYTRAFKKMGDAFHHIRMLIGYILGFTDVRGEIEEMDGRIGVISHLEADSLPVAHANGLRLSIGMEFPVEILVRLLFAMGESGHVGDAIGVLGGVNASEIAKRGH